MKKKVWITKDRHRNPMWDWVGIFDLAPPIRDDEASRGNVWWMAPDSGRCVVAEFDTKFIAELGIDLQPGECREAEIEITLIDAK